MYKTKLTVIIYDKYYVFHIYYIMVYVEYFHFIYVIHLIYIFHVVYHPFNILTKLPLCILYKHTQSTIPSPFPYFILFPTSFTKINNYAILASFFLSLYPIISPKKQTHIPLFDWAPPYHTPPIPLPPLHKTYSSLHPKR